MQLITKQQHIVDRCAKIAQLTQQLATQDLTATQKAEIAQNIKVHTAVIKELQK